ncbi:MAG: FAD:protein FMN transferase [Ramlibacter sp.]|nr:FAD:protein FMN transferase [Cryobacterium sp.]
MGTVVSIRLGADAGADAGAGADADAAALEARAAVEDVFRRWDEQFSLYRPDSELSRVNRGDLRLTQASNTLRVCYALALDWRDRTDGVFTPHRADGAIDLSGVVKSLAIQEAGDMLAARGAGDWSLNAGGDILVRGHQAQGQAWLAAIVDPADRQAVLASVPLALPLRAVASSGSAERGEHIWSTVDGGVSPYRQVSVFGRDIVTADVLATTIVAGGEAALNRSTETFEIEVLAVLRDGSLLATPGLRGGPA